MGTPVVDANTLVIKFGGLEGICWCKDLWNWKEPVWNLSTE